MKQWRRLVGYLALVVVAVAAAQTILVFAGAHLS